MNITKIVSDHKKTFVGVVIVLALFVGASYGFYSLNGDSLDPRDTDIRVIVTGSMDAGDTGYPISTIPKDSLVFIHKLNTDDLDDVRIGDVLSYDNGSVIVVHRVIAIDTEKETFTLKGDANESTEIVQFEQVRGIVVGVSHFLGEVVEFARSHTVLMIASIACLIVAVWCMYEIITTTLKKRKEII